MSNEEKIDWDKLTAEWDAYWRANMTMSTLDAFTKFWEDRGGMHRYFFNPNTPIQTTREYLGPTSGEIAETLRTMDKGDIWQKVETLIVPEPETCPDCGAASDKPHILNRDPASQKYDVRVTSNFHKLVVMDWVTVQESGLRLLLRRVCGASATQANEFITYLEKGVPTTFNGVDGQEGLAYTLTAIS